MVANDAVHFELLEALLGGVVLVQMQVVLCRMGDSGCRILN